MGRALASALLCWSLARPSAEARCLFRLEVWPQTGATLPSDGAILVSVHHQPPPRDWSAVLQDPPAFWLDGEGKRVRLLVTATLEGFQLTQYLLTPAEDVIGEFELRSARIPYRSDYDSDAPARWHFVARHHDPSPVRWASQPTFVDTYFDDMSDSCDKSQIAWLGAPLLTERAWVKAIVEPESDEVPEDEYPLYGPIILPVRDGLVPIGHFICGGGVFLMAGRRYRATLTALDEAGHEAACGAEVEFTAPGRYIGPDERATVLGDLRRIGAVGRSPR